MVRVSYLPDVNYIAMPVSYQVQTWEKFFAELMKLDYTSPFHVVLSRYHIVAAKDFTLPPSVYGKLYYNVGAEMATAHHFPIETAAENVGFLQKGIRMIASAVIADGGQDSNLLTAAKLVFEDRYNWKVLSKNITPALEEVLVQDVNTKETSELPVKNNENHRAWWIWHFENEMLIDDNAATSILSYYLEAVIGKACTMLCPFEHPPYREMGEKIAENNIVMDAAMRSGLLTTGVSNFVKTALSAKDCWLGMVESIAYLLKHPTLRSFIPFRSRYVAAKMIHYTDDIKKGLEDWDKLRKLWENTESDEIHGY